MKTLLRRLRGEADWEPPVPKQAVDACVARLPVPLPDDLRAVYEFSNGGTIAKVDLFMLDELEDVNVRQPHMTEAHPGGIYFASDGSDGFFLLDPQGRVQWVDRAMPSRTVPSGDSLSAFLGTVADGKLPWLDPPRDKRPPSAAAELLRQHRERYRGEPVDMERDESGEAGRRLGVRLPSALQGIYLVASGLRIDSAGITVRSPSQLDAVRGSDGAVDLIWFAEDDHGRRFGVTARTWRRIPLGEVVAVDKDAQPENAPVIGGIPDVLARWLGEK